MALQTVVESLEAVPETARDFYVEQDGQYVLDTDQKDRINEFRTNNISLKQELEKHQEKLKAYDGIDPDKYQELTALERQKRDKELIEAGELETLLNERLSEVKTTYDKQVEDLKTALNETRGELVKTKVTDTLKTAAADSGVLPKAMNDVVKLASSDWELRDGTPTLIQDGEVVLSKEKPGEPMSMGEYFKNMLQEKPYYFQSSAGSGGGSQHNARGAKVIPNDPVLIGQYADQIAKGEVVIEGS